MGIKVFHHLTRKVGQTARRIVCSFLDLFMHSQVKEAKDIIDSLQHQDYVFSSRIAEDSKVFILRVKDKRNGSYCEYCFSLAALKYLRPLREVLLGMAEKLVKELEAKKEKFPKFVKES